MFSPHFRAKSNGIWVYGHYYNNCDRGVNQSFIVSDNEETGIGDHFLVDSNTLSVCTGLRDLQSKLIFEGDFLEDLYKDEDIEIISYVPVVYNNDTATFCIDNSYYKNHISLVSLIDYFGSHLVVNGNIFENPERLSQQNYNKPDRSSVDGLPF